MIESIIRQKKELLIKEALLLAPILRELNGIINLSSIILTFCGILKLPPLDFFLNLGKLFWSLKKGVLELEWVKEKCWCLVIKPKEPIFFQMKSGSEDNIYVANSGCSHAEHICEIHNNEIKNKNNENK